MQLLAQAGGVVSDSGISIGVVVLLGAVGYFLNNLIDRFLGGDTASALKQVKALVVFLVVAFAGSASDLFSGFTFNGVVLRDLSVIDLIFCAFTMAGAWGFLYDWAKPNVPNPLRRLVSSSPTISRSSPAPSSTPGASPGS